MQRRLNYSKITIIGVGTLGSGVLFNLAGLGVENVRIVDFDTVELSNLNRQLLFKEEDIGRRKIDAAKDFIRRFYSRMELECIPSEIRSTDSFYRWWCECCRRAAIYRRPWKNRLPGLQLSFTQSAG